jgi:hypothetical protein
LAPVLGDDSQVVNVEQRTRPKRREAEETHRDSDGLILHASEQHERRRMALKRGNQTFTNV